MFETEKQAKEMARWVIVCAGKSDALSLALRTYKVGRRTDFSELSSDLRVCTMTHAH